MPTLQVQMPMSDSTFVEPGPPTRFKWPYGADVYPVAVEWRNGNPYWFMRKTVSGQRHNLYLAPAGRGQREDWGGAAGCYGFAGDAGWADVGDGGS